MKAIDWVLGRDSEPVRHDPVSPDTEEIVLKNYFRDWAFNHYVAQSPDGKYSLWHCNGFGFFRDATMGIGIRDRPSAELLPNLSRWGRYRLWRALKAEKRLRKKEEKAEIKRAAPKVKLR